MVIRTPQASGQSCGQAAWTTCFIPWIIRGRWSSREPFLFPADGTRTFLSVCRARQRQRTGVSAPHKHGTTPVERAWNIRLVPRHSLRAIVPLSPFGISFAELLYANPSFFFAGDSSARFGGARTNWVQR